MTNVSPYREKLEDGVEVNKAWEQSKDEIDENSRYGTWKADYFLSKPDPTGRFCHATEIRSANAESTDYLSPSALSSSRRYRICKELQLRTHIAFILDVQEHWSC